MRLATLSILLLAALGAPALAGPPAAGGARKPRARVLAEPAVLAVGEVHPGQPLPLKVHLTNQGQGDAIGLQCKGPGFAFPAIDVPAGGVADVEGSYTPPEKPALRKARRLVAKARCDRATVQLKGTLVPCPEVGCTPAVATSAATSAATGPGASPATGAALLGVWNVKAMGSGADRSELPEGMKLSMDFQRDGALVLHVTFGDQASEERATWEATDRILKVTSEGGKVDEMEYTVTNGTLRLVGKGDGETVEAVR